VFGKFKEGPAYGREHNYTCETTAQNLWNKKIDAVFSLYLFDKSNVRIGEGYVKVSNVGPGEMIKFQTTFHVGGALEHMDRNKIKRMLLVERDPPNR
jgi:hypothetical protein